MNLTWLFSFLTDSVFALVYFRRSTYAPYRQRRWMEPVLLLLLLPFYYNGGEFFPETHAIVRILARMLVYFCMLRFCEGVPLRVSIYASLFWTAAYTLFQNIFFGPFLNSFFMQGAAIVPSPMWNSFFLSVCAVAVRGLYFAVVAFAAGFPGMVGADSSSICFAIALCSIASYAKTTGKDFTPDFADAEVPFSAYYILLNIALLLLLLLYEYSRRHTLQAAALRLQNTEAQALLESVRGRQHSDESIRALRHDLKNHTIALQLLLERGDTEGALRYLNTFREQADVPAGIFHTGNDLLDGLLRQKLLPVLEQGVAVKVSIDFRQGTFIDPFDLCILMGNVLDNAIEACSRLPSPSERLINVSGGPSANFLLIRVENSCATGLSFSNELPQTTKANAFLHGFGLRNIQQVLNRYDGNLTVNAAEHGKFVSTMLIPIPEQYDFA